MIESKNNEASAAPPQPAEALNPEPIPAATPPSAEAPPVLPESIPYDRFSSVVSERNTLRDELTGLNEKFESLRQSTLTEKEREKEEIEILRQKAQDFDHIQAELAQSKAWIEQQAKTWVEALADEKKADLSRYAQVKGIEPDDHRTLYKEGVALDALGMLGFNQQQGTQTRPPALPTHAGQPSHHAPPNGVDPGSKEGMRLRLRELLGRQ